MLAVVNAVDVVVAAGSNQDEFLIYVRKLDKGSETCDHNCRICNGGYSDSRDNERDSLDYDETLLVYNGILIYDIFSSHHSRYSCVKL